VDGGPRLDWTGLGARVSARGRALREAGVAPGARVALLEDNTPAFLVETFAVARIGAVLVSLNTRLAPRELAAILAHSGAVLLVHGERHEAVARELADRARLARHALSAAEAGPPDDRPPAAVRGSDPAQLHYTSGTTGRPKGVVLTHGNVVCHARAAVAELGLGPADRWGHVAPMFHLADAWATLAVTAVGGTHLFVPRFDVAAVLELVERGRMTITNLIPTMLARLVAAPEARAIDASSLRVVLSGGAPISPRLVRAVLETFGCEYVQTYGMTETSPYLTLSLLDERQRRLPPAEVLRLRARTGRPFAGVELEVVDERDRPVPADDRTVGEIRVRGPSVSPGYWNDPDETARAFRGGWLYTGDLAVVDAQGSVDIVDRKKDMILTGGESVYSIEVENALYEHPAVLEAAAYGLPDAEWGEVVCAAVAPRPGHTLDPDELRAFCRARLAGYKVPRRIRVLDELPKTATGKLAKRLLRERADPAL